ncbi:MAG: domain S-box [Polyangiaceae bacterium]|nr:domain S-box [Polyangiaceae bacterium]
MDDEADSRELVAAVLQASGADVTAAASTQIALQELSAVVPHVLVSDVGMPELDGYELIRRVRSLADARGAAIRAIALTAYSREQDRRKALASGFDSHIAKPVEPAALVRLVASLVRPPSAG